MWRTKQFLIKKFFKPKASFGFKELTLINNLMI